MHYKELSAFCEVDLDLLQVVLFKRQHVQSESESFILKIHHFSLENASMTMESKLTRWILKDSPT